MILPQIVFLMKNSTLKNFNFGLVLLTPSAMTISHLSGESLHPPMEFQSDYYSP